MERKKRVFLISSFLILALSCSTTFTWLITFMSKQTQATVNDISRIYMQQMNIQLKQKFDAIVDIRQQQVAAIVQDVSPDRIYKDRESLESELAHNANIRGFQYMAFYTKDGALTTIYGNNVTINTLDNINASLEEDGRIIDQGNTDEGDNLLLIGKSVSYPMFDGKKSDALVVGISMEYLNQAMFMDIDETSAYSHIIREDGNFIIRNAGVYRESYFLRMHSSYQGLDGMTVDEMISGLKQAIAENRDYSAHVMIDGIEHQLYCSPMSGNKTWYLVSLMQDTMLNNAITGLDSARISSMLIALSAIIVVMLVIFIIYYNLSAQQVREINAARQEAVRANMAKSEFLSSMSHDIRTPMNAIIGMTEIALKKLDDKARVEDCLKKVKMSSKHLLGLINDVLDMSKIESGKMTLNIYPFSLREVVDDIVNIMQSQIKANNQSFDIFIQKIISERVHGDNVRLNQVLLNILSNAVKFTPEKGKIDVYVYQEESPRGDEYVRTHFRIRDTGIGMSEEFQKKIFDSFSREEIKKVHETIGTGLGMSITKHIVDLMEGTIGLKSKLGEGSEFHITIDFKRANDDEEMILPEWNVLVVDDNEQLCISAVDSLTELGTHAEWVDDGMRAVEMIEERHNQNNDYHFVLLDWKMPGMDGLQTLREIRKRVGDDIPIFLISAYDWNEIEEEANSAGVRGFISKPLFKSTLYYCLKEYSNESKDEEVEVTQQQQIDFTGKHILLSEDIEINWEIANEILTSVGLEVDRAENGKICVEMFEKSELNHYDVVLMDLMMPVMDGYESSMAIRKLDRADSNIPIIAMTADVLSDAVQKCKDCGMNDHIGKPIDIKELMLVLQKYLG